MQRNDACPIEHAAKIAIYPVRAKEKTEKVAFCHHENKHTYQSWLTSRDASYCG